MSKIFRYNGPAEGTETSAILVLRKRKPRPSVSAAFIAADHSSITDANGTRPIGSYRDIAHSDVLTLTRQEADLVALANPGIRAPRALEDVYPWLPHRPFLNDSTASYRVLSAVVRRYGAHFVTASDYCDTKWATVCNTVRRKNALDARFHNAWHAPVQDVYLLEERRPGRSVVAIDFNAMYSACMQHPFPKPSALRHLRIDRTLEADETLRLGLYRCRLADPRTDFIRQHNPFRSFLAGRRFRAPLAEPVIVDLNEFEIAYYRRHFAHIHIVDGIVSDQSIAHPLAREALRSFARRRNFRAQGNTPLADREKLLATFLASCTSRPHRKRRSFPNRDEALAHLRAVCGIDPPADEPDSAFDMWIRSRKGIAMTDGGLDHRVIMDDPLSDTACFSLGQRIVARGRILLLEMMEHVLSAAPAIQLCYVNIDSIHFSVPNEHLDEVVDALAAQASDEMGSFKVEAVTRHGLWLEPGRYWLYSDRIAKFRNRGIARQANPFRDHSIHVTHRRIGELDIPIRMTLHMERSLSDLRALVRDSAILRQCLIEFGSGTTFASVLQQLEQNRKESTPFRLAAFRDLAHRFGPAPLPRGENEPSITVPHVVGPSGACSCRTLAAGTEQSPGRSC